MRMVGGGVCAIRGLEGERALTFNRESRNKSEVSSRKPGYWDRHSFLSGVQLGRRIEESTVGGPPSG